MQINLSELDKVSLNILFQPVYGEYYNPKIGRTGLYYWGREVMERHNFPAESITDGIWGPQSGPNWSACRVLRTGKMDALNKMGKFQGYSGMIYCGEKTEKKLEHHDGVWGPDNGSPWDDCLIEIYDELEQIVFKSRFKKMKKKKTSAWVIF